ncbi:MAG: pyridoxamine 5'-phosphate oxidase family protein [Bacteroidales bacterium]|nr:pyridoxamine 5'-phosphate oxidase family protein [Bacteroidales bacterium]
MKRITDFLEKSRVQYLATIGLDGRPKVRPFQYMFENGGKLWFCTSNQKEVYKELSHQPYVELCASGKNMSWLRLEGKVVFSDDIKVKEHIFELSPLVAGIYKEPDNSSFAVFYLDELSASISTIGKAAELIRL